MNIDNFYKNLKAKTQDLISQLKDKKMLYLFIAFVAVLILLFFAPLFQAPVGTTIIGCVAAPYIVLIWRRLDKENAIVPAFYFSIAMIIASIIYLAAGSTQQKYTPLFYVLSLIVMFFFANSQKLDFYDKIKDSAKAYITALVLCVALVIVSNLIVLLFSIAWWIICIIAFLALIIAFFAFVYGSAAYTATDDTRQRNRRKTSERISRSEPRERRVRERVVFDPESNTYDANFDDEDDDEDGYIF